MGDTGKFLMNVLAILVIGGVVARLTLFDVVVIDSNAMAPTLVYGDEVLVLRFGGYDMADIVICEHPAYPGTPVIGRAVAFAGHTIHTGRRGGLYVGADRATIDIHGSFLFYDAVRGRQFEMQHGEVSYHDRHQHEFLRLPGAPLRIRKTTVAQGAYLLGDNRREWTLDSRKFGEVDLDTCIGTVFMRYKPAPDNGDDIDHGHLELIR